MKAKVAERGQVTIPKRIRDQLGIRKGTVLDFREEKGRIIAMKTEASHPVLACYGSLSLGRRTDQLMDELRAHADSC